MNFEENPQPVMTVTPGESTPGLLPQMMPPPYSMAVTEGQAAKPPAYTDIYKQDTDTTTAPTNVNNPATPATQREEVDTTATECVATGGAAVLTTPTTTTTPVTGAQSSFPVPTAAAAAISHNTSVTLPKDGDEDEAHATVTPGGGIAVV